MLRSLLVGLDGSDDCWSPLGLGIEWARRDDALLVGLGIIDEPTIAKAAPVMLGGAPNTDPIVYRERMADARRQVDQFPNPSRFLAVFFFRSRGGCTAWRQNPA
jgi:hypothetical protein